MLVRYIVDDDRCKIGEARSWAEAGELRNLKVGYVVPLRIVIGPCLQLAGLHFLYTISASRACLCLAIHDQFDSPRLVLTFLLDLFCSVAMTQFCRLHEK